MKKTIGKKNRGKNNNGKNNVKNDRKIMGKK